MSKKSSNTGARNNHKTDSLDSDGYYRIVSELSASRRLFKLEIDSSEPMDWHAVLLALSDWLCEEAKKLAPSKGP
jgi:hypothetical protein